MTNPDHPQAQDSKGGAARALFFLLLGPIAWAAHHIVMYASHTLVCSLGLLGNSFLTLDPMRAVAVAATASAVALSAAPLAAPGMLSRGLGMQPGTDWRFYRNTAGLLAVLSMFGIALNGAMAFIIPACLSLR